MYVIHNCNDFIKMKYLQWYKIPMIVGFNNRLGMPLAHLQQYITRASDVYIYILKLLMIKLT